MNNPLEVEVLGFYPMENADPHNTIKYEIVQNESKPVIRRGQPFQGAVRFKREFDEQNDVVQFLFQLDASETTQETEVLVTLERDVVADKNSWSAKLTDVLQSTLMFEVSTPVTLPVGRWVVRVVTRRRDSDESFIDVDNEQGIFILFNPWIADDQTHMEDCALLQEYVLNDVGKVWVGPIQTTRGRPWVYGQFDAVVLEACMLILDRALSPLERGDPVQVSRGLSRIVNSNDDDGVLYGRWDGHYEDGISPSEWTGSVEILGQYLETQVPVSYGQCWVFAGVVTTICRALGIPSRVVSNLVSAHDANKTLTVDKYYNEDMSEIDHDPNNEFGGADSIWNYHVWNDVWMSRPDLPPGYGGWQAVDATPQEQSSGLFQCGPAPLEAIKKGVTVVDYDVEFMLASVNADMMRWRRDPNSNTGFSVVDTNNYHIGRQILTKKPYVFDPLGDNDRVDILSEYKHREGTDPERLALMNGVRRSERAKRYYEVAGSAQNEFKFKLREIDAVKIGEDFRFTVEVENTSDEGREVNMSLSATSVFYNGVKAGEIKKGASKIWVGPQKRDELSILVRADDYLPKLVEYYNVKVSAMAMVMETKQAWADDDDFQFLKPTIDISFNEDLIIDQQATAVLSFKNPLHRSLTGCEFRVSSGGFVGRAVIVPAPNAAPGQLVMAELPVVPNKLGNIYIVATFKSSELNHIDGAATVQVLEG